MFSISSGTASNLQCTEHQFPEFPDLLFGTTPDGISYFDATSYLQKNGNPPMEEFFKTLQVPIVALVNAYELDRKKVHLITPDKHHLIDSNLVYLFIAFVEPGFWGYMMDRIHEMFSHGFCASDSYIMASVKNRFTTEALSELIRNGGN